MSITDEIVRTIAQAQPRLLADQSFIELRAFYERMTRAGIVLHHPYSVGRATTMSTPRPSLSEIKNAISTPAGTAGEA